MVDIASRLDLELRPTRPTAPATARADPGRYLAPTGLVVGVALLAIAYGVAGRSADGGAEYLWFWAGMFVFLVPATVRLWSTRPSVAERYGILIGLGLFTYAPKYLRNPDGPLFFDELAHWNETRRLLRTGDLFHANPLVSMSEPYPGLRAVTAWMHHTTGLAVWDSAHLLLLGCHVVALLGIVVIALRVSRSYRIAGVAALLYALNPGFLFFNSQFAYESLAIVLAIWAVACVLEGLALPRGVTRGGWLTAGVLLAVACCATHHLSSLVLLLALLVIACTHSVRTRRGAPGETSPRAAWSVLGFVLVIQAAWIAFLAPGVLDYLYRLSPLPSLGGTTIGGGSRRIFRDSGLPTVEQIVAFGAPVIAAGLAGVGWLTSRRRPDRFNARPLVVILAAAYVLTLPLVALNAGIEGAHRSWPFSYIGVAILAATGLVDGVRRLGLVGRVGGRIAATVVVVLVALLAVGNLATDVNGYYRFPGPWKPGSDSRNLTAEMRAATRWFRTTIGADQGVIAPMPDNAAFSALAGARVAWSEPLWDLYFYPEVRNPALLRRLAAGGYDYLVVDRRMATTVSRIGFSFTADEPGAFTRTRPLPKSSLEKFRHVPWATPVFSSEHLAVYHVDLRAAAREAEAAARVAKTATTTTTVGTP